MIRLAAFLAFACSLIGCALAAGCAAPGEPVARHPIVPVKVSDLSVRQYGAAFELTFTLPTKSTDKANLAEHPSIEIERATLAPGAAPDKKATWRVVDTIPSEQVDHYLTGERIDFRDPIAATDLALPAGSTMAYKVRTREVKSASQDSNVVTARIYQPPEAPRDAHIDVTETTLVLSWSEAPVPPGAASRIYRVYRGVLESAQASPSQDLSQMKFKSPLELQGTSPSTQFRDSNFEFGTPYVYTVRTLAQFGSDLVESADSAPAVITPRDVYPPITPTGLEISVVPATPQAPPYVELSWSINPETDLAGYSVYRSDREDLPGERVSTEILPSPTFRDMSVQQGRRYYYRVSAVDRAGNESPRSSAVAAEIP